MQYFVYDFSDCCPHLHCCYFQHNVSTAVSGVTCLSGHRNDSTWEIIFNVWQRRLCQNFQNIFFLFLHSWEFWQKLKDCFPSLSNWKVIFWRKLKHWKISPSFFGCSLQFNCSFTTSMGEWPDDWGSQVIISKSLFLFLNPGNFDKRLKIILHLCLIERWIFKESILQTLKNLTLILWGVSSNSPNNFSHTNSLEEKTED